MNPKSPASLALLALTMLSGCGGSYVIPPGEFAGIAADDGLVVFGVETNRTVASVELCSKQGASCLAVGPFEGPQDVYLLRLPPDTYCIDRIRGVSWTIASPSGPDGTGLCINVPHGFPTYPGHLRITQVDHSQTSTQRVRVTLSRRGDISTIVSTRYPEWRGLGSGGAPPEETDDVPETNFVEPVRTTRPSSANISQALQRIEPGLGECVDSTGVPPDSSIAISIFSLGTTGATEQVDVQVNGQEHPALKKCIIDVIVDADPLLPPFDSVGKFINFEVVPSTGGIDVRARGVLPRQTIRDVIRSHLDEVRSCYNEGLRRNPELAGKLTIQFIIDANGKVRSVEVVDADPFPDSEVAACVANAALKWLFPEPRGGGDVTVTYPFSFKTEVRTPSSNSE